MLVIRIYGGGKMMFIKSKKIIVALVVIILLIICTIIGVYGSKDYTNATREIKDTIAIGKDQTYVNCYGKGTPTVIFESGFGGSYSNWAQEQPEISKIARTFSYTRIENGRTTLDQVHELHALLEKTKVKGPYIIVAHSIAGFNARLFAGTYPNEVKGIVFVDCACEDEATDQRYTNQMPKELTDLIGIDASQVKEITQKDALRNIPIIVLTSDHFGAETFPGDSATWTKYQNGIASLSNKSKHIFVKDSSHLIQSDHPQVVIDAIKDIIKQVNK